MVLVVRQLTDKDQCEKLWSRLYKGPSHPALKSRLKTLSDYEEWKTNLERGVGSFWTTQGERLAILAGFQDEEPIGLVRVLKVPIFPWDRGDWGTDGFRGEIQDLLWEEANENAASELVKRGVEFLKEKGLEKIGVSCWRQAQCEVLRRLGFKPFRRNTFLGWRTDADLHVEPKLSCRIHYVGPGDEKLVQEVFTSTWGFPVTFLPRMEIQRALVALHEGRPVGTVLMNNYSGSLDLGVQVVSEHRRKHVGSLLVREALHYYRDKGFENMYVIRNLPVNGLREEDEVALQFYASTGAFPLREYVGFQPGQDGRAYRSESWLHSSLERRHSPIHGSGLFAARPIKTDEVVLIFGGTLFSRSDIETGKANRRSLMQVDEGLWLGNRAEESEGEDYFINHSCDPNLWMHDEATLVARRDISRGEEVTMDYAMHFADPEWKMKGPCICGSSECRQTIRGTDGMLDDLQRRYGAHFSPLINRRILQSRLAE